MPAKKVELVLKTEKESQVTAKQKEKKEEKQAKGRADEGKGQTKPETRLSNQKS